jgi:transmembrane sensor
LDRNVSASGQQQKVEAKAANWVIRLGGVPLRDDEQRRLDRWLAEHPAHEAAFARARSTWGELAALQTAPGMLLDDAVPSRSRPMPVPGNRLGWTRRAIMTGAAAAVVAVLTGAGFGAFWYGNPMLMLASDYRTSPGESRTVTLADGSTVQLDTASAIAVHFDGHERRVELLSGTAYFTVTPMQGSETRPFVVAVANGTAKALGTQFMVDRQGDGAEVTAAEHRVEVTADRADENKAGVVVLSPGQSVRYDRSSGLGAVSQVDIDRATAWRRGRLVIDRMRLADVIAALNRYRRGEIVITDAALADRRVSGVFETADLAGALAAITQELGVRMASIPPFVTLLY